MSISNWLEKIEKRLYWGVIGTTVTILFGALGLYLWLQEDKPDISYDINEANVLDIRKPLKELEIYFQKKDIQKENLNLRILTIQVTNDGEINILQSHFDRDIRWGFRVENGTIIDEVRLINSNSEYLKASLEPKVVEANIVEFKKLIFETGKFFTLEVLVLHSKERLPEIVPIGKIVGIEKIIPVKSWLEKEQKTFLDRFFHGGLLLNLARVLVFSIGGVALFLLIIRILIEIELKRSFLRGLWPFKAPIEDEGKQISGEGVFYDDLEDYIGWEKYLEGEVFQTDAVAYVGNHSLMKASNDDPNGGYKEIRKEIGLGVVFSGWIYRPANQSGGRGDRLALEDSEFNGYGFFIDHNAKTARIERRGKGNPTRMSSIINFTPPTDEWYQFKFFMRTSGTFDLLIYDSSGRELTRVENVSDKEYKSFDRVVVHGGCPYYVDGLRIQTISEEKSGLEFNPYFTLDHIKIGQKTNLNFEFKNHTKDAIHCISYEAESYYKGKLVVRFEKHEFDEWLLAGEEKKTEWDNVDPLKAYFNAMTNKGHYELKIYIEHQLSEKLDVKKIVNKAVLVVE